MANGKYKQGDIIRHYKGGDYVIVHPVEANLHLEDTGEPAYAYKAINGIDPRIWVRSQALVEDTQKFTLLED